MKFLIVFTLLATLAHCAQANIFASVGKPICGGSSSSKNIQLQIPKTPPRDCVYRIEAYSKHVCQLRVELKYTLAQPSIPGAGNKLRYAMCDRDYFQVGDMRLCGEETLQHLYVPFNRTAGVKSVELSLTLANRVGYHGLPTPHWDIKVTQLECPEGASVRSLMHLGRSVSNSDGYLVAPPGCLQYFPRSSGTVTSFNFMKGKGVYPGNMNYAICFRRDTGTTALKLTSSFFQLGVDATGAKVDSSCYGGFNTNTDYLMVPQGEIKRKFEKVTYLCGDSMKNQEVISTNPGPLMVLFNSNDHYRNESGFSFNYNVVN